MKPAVETFLFLTLFGCGSVVIWCVVTLGYASRRETRNTSERLEAMTRHPAGERLPANGCDGLRMSTPDPLRAPCGAWIGDGVCDYWEREFAAISHTLECATCRVDSERRGA